MPTPREGLPLFTSCLEEVFSETRMQTGASLCVWTGANGSLLGMTHNIYSGFRCTEFSETQLVPLLILGNSICRGSSICSGPSYVLRVAA